MQDKHIQVYADAMAAKRDAELRAQDDARQRLMDEVIAGREEQLRQRELARCGVLTLAVRRPFDRQMTHQLRDSLLDRPISGHKEHLCLHKLPSCGAWTVRVERVRQHVVHFRNPGLICIHSRVAAAVAEGGGGRAAAVREGGHAGI